MTIDDFTRKLNHWGAQRTPFFFMVDFEFHKPFASTLTAINPDQLLYSFRGVCNYNQANRSAATGQFIEHTLPMDLKNYRKRFENVVKRICYGDSFLTNLTLKTEVKLGGVLLDIFFQCDATYKLWYQNEFLVFSPEKFVFITDHTISAYPMKGTIDASIPNAAARILADIKEMAEHVTIVDLIRNDLSRVATDVRVKTFRYIDRLRTDRSELLQVSSEICGTLNKGWQSCLGEIILNLLPAGSVSGAPKPMTLQIISETEGEPRGYYTGVMGIFDGQNLDSAVMIRYIERDENRYFYRSGGGITAKSNLLDEYHEVLAKVYIPVSSLPVVR